MTPVVYILMGFCIGMVAEFVHAQRQLSAMSKIYSTSLDLSDGYAERLASQIEELLAIINKSKDINQEEVFAVFAKYGE